MALLISLMIVPATTTVVGGCDRGDGIRGVPGIILANATSGAGSIDVNTRGMQGLGQVSVKVDGADNQITIYQGY